MNLALGLLLEEQLFALISHLPNKMKKSSSNMGSTMAPANM